MSMWGARANEVNKEVNALTSETIKDEKTQISHFEYKPIYTLSLTQQNRHLFFLNTVKIIAKLKLKIFDLFLKNQLYLRFIIIKENLSMECWKISSQQL